MIRTMNMKHFFAPSAWRLEGAVRRAAMTLLLCVMTTMTAWAETVTTYYVDADGTTHDGVTATVLTGSETTLAAGTYLVNSNITYDHMLKLGNGTVNIILADGKTMRIGTEGSPIQGNGITNNDWMDKPALHIYGQTTNTDAAGSMEVYSTYGIYNIYSYTQHSGNVKSDTTTGYGNAFYVSGFTLNGGKLTVATAYSGIVCGYLGVTINGGVLNATSNSTNNNDAAISGGNGDVTINGGQVTVTAPNGAKGITSDQGDIILGCSSETDFIQASSYLAKDAENKGKVVKIAGEQTLYCSGFPSASFTGTIDDPSVLNGQTLRPVADVTESGPNEYTIRNAEGWDAFCDRLAADDGKAFFSGKTVRLAGDITVTRMADGQPFTGTFDGDGHTLTLNYGTADAPVDAQFVAPFVETTWSTTPTFRNLTIDGTIYATYTGSEEHNVGGLIGHLFGDVTIEHCTSNVHITAPGGAGGFVGLCEHTAMFTDCVSSTVITSPGGNNSGFVSWSRASGHAISFEGCVFNGKLLQQNGVGSTNGCFIGWTGSNKTVTITNSLCAPAATTSGESMATSNSATFARGWNETTTATNSYYTTAFGTAQGIAAHTIAAGENVSVAHAGVATTYDVSHITAYKASAQGTTFTPGLLYNNNVLYAGNGEAVSLTLTNIPPTGYVFGGYTASPDGATLSEDGDNYTLTMPDANVTITATFSLLSVAYIDENGVVQYKQPGEYTVLTGGGATTLAGGWYVVNSDITYTGTVTLGGDVNIILADGKTLNIGTADNRISSGNCIKSVIGDLYAKYSLTIYSQSTEGNGMGKLNAYNSDSYGVNVKNYTQHGGNVTLDTANNPALYINGGNLTLTRGTLTVNATIGSRAIYLRGNTATVSGGTLNATDPNGCGIYGNLVLSGTATVTLTGSYALYGSVTIAPAHVFTDGNGHYYSGTLSSDEKTAINGQTLTRLTALQLADNASNTAAIDKCNGATGLDITLQGRTLWKDGAWNTLVLPFPIADIEADGCPLKGATVRELNDASITGTTLTLNFKPATTAIAAGTPYIVKWANGTAGQYTQDPVFQGVTIDATDHSYDTQPLTDTESATYDPSFKTDERVRFIGTYDRKTIDTEDQSILFLGAANTLYYPSGQSTTTIGAFRAYFKIGDDDTSNARQLTAFNFSFADGSEDTGIVSVSKESRSEGVSPAWYTLDGVRLDGKPTKKGLYIVNGKKVVVK